MNEYLFLNAQQRKALLRFLPPEALPELDLICDKYIKSKQSASARSTRAEILKRMEAFKGRFDDYIQQGEALRRDLAEFSHSDTNHHMLPAIEGIRKVNDNLRLMLKYFGRAKTPVKIPDRPGWVDATDYLDYKRYHTRICDYFLVSDVISLIEKATGKPVSRDSNENSSARSVLEICNPANCSGLPKVIRRVLKITKDYK